MQEACCDVLQALALGDTPSHAPIRDCGGIEAMVSRLCLADKAAAERAVAALEEARSCWPKEQD